MRKNTYRTPETQKAFVDQREEHKDEHGDPFGDWESRLVKKWNYWALIRNLFPMDAIASKNDILIPLRVFPNEMDMTGEEFDEFMMIKEELGQEYDSMLQNFMKKRTSLLRFHLHFFNANEME